MRFTSVLVAAATLSGVFASFGNFGHPDSRIITNIKEKLANESKGRGGHSYKPCAGYSTRDASTCLCKGDLVESVNWWDAGFHKRGGHGGGCRGGNCCGEWPRKECVCPDAPNTFLDWKKGEPICKCPGARKEFDSSKDECICKDDFVAKRDKKTNELSCKPPPPQTSPQPNKTPKKRAFREAITQRRNGVETRQLENLMGCQVNERACDFYGSWSCVDILSSVATCGGCAAEAVDCAALPNIDTVDCVQGSCVIKTCARGFELADNECVSASKSFKWFTKQE